MTSRDSLTPQELFFRIEPCLNSHHQLLHSILTLDLGDSDSQVDFFDRIPAPGDE